MDIQTLIAELELLVGEPVALQRLGRRASNFLWRAVGQRSRARWIVKQYRAGRGFAQEWAAYRTFVPGLPPRTTPDFVGAIAGCRSLVWGEVVGEPVAENDLAAHRRAGQFLRSLHSQEVVDGDQLPVSQAIALRVQRAVGGAHKLLHGAELARLRPVLEQPELFAASRRVVCHRDFGPHNWLVQNDCSYIFIDFEHARHDVVEADFVKLAAGPWRRFPAAQEAFWQGYGAVLRPQARARLELLVVLHGLSTLAWTAGAREPAREHEARTLLAPWLT